MLKSKKIFQNFVFRLYRRKLQHIWMGEKKLKKGFEIANFKKTEIVFNNTCFF